MRPRDLQGHSGAAGPPLRPLASGPAEGRGAPPMRHGTPQTPTSTDLTMLIHIGMCLNLFEYRRKGAYPVGSFQRCSAAGPVRPKATGAPGPPLLDVTA